MKILSVEAELFHADEQTNMSKLNSLFAILLAHLKIIRDNRFSEWIAKLDLTVAAIKIWILSLREKLYFVVSHMRYLLIVSELYAKPSNQCNQRAQTDIGVVTGNEILLGSFFDTYANAVFCGLVCFSIYIKYEIFLTQFLININNFEVINITIQLSTLYNCQVIVVLWSMLPAVVERSCRRCRRMKIE
jgi:hypothetical protein